MIIITGSANFLPQHRPAALALGVAHSVRSRAELGCIAHNCHIDAEDPNRIVFVEEWSDVSAVKTHFAVPESREFVRQMETLANGAPQMKIFEAKELNRG